MLAISSRFYDLERQRAIRNIYDAIIELVTNSHDAYTKGFSQSAGTELMYRTIDISTNRDKRSLIVADHAIGMSKDEMDNNLLKVGELSAHTSARGLMGRGAKDITALGDVIFTSFNSNKINQLKIKNDMSYEWMIVEEDVTEESKDMYGMYSNGFHVELLLKPEVDLATDDLIHNYLCKNVYLRHIVMSENHPMLFNGRKVVYQYPKSKGEGKPVVDASFEIDGYPGVTADLKMYIAEDPIPGVSNSDLMEYGILLCSDTTVYEMTGCKAESPEFPNDHLWGNRMIRYVRGELRCNYIDYLARDISVNGPSIENPHMIIDPGRRHGLSKSHPFTKALFAVPYKFLEIVLNRVQDMQDDHYMVDESMGEFFDNIGNFLSEKLDIEKTVYTWRSKSDQENLKYMVGRINKIEVDKELEIDDSIIDNIRNKKDLVPIPVQDKSGKSRVIIKLTDDPSVTDQYDISYMSDKVIIKINVNDQSIRPFVEIEPQENASSLIHLSPGLGNVSVTDTVVDAVTHMLTRQTLLSKVDVTNSTTDNLNEIKEIQGNIRSKIARYTGGLYTRLV